MACKYKYKDKWYSEIEVKNQLLKDISLNDVIVELSSQMSYTVEINTAGEKVSALNNNYDNFNIENDNYQIQFFQNDWELGVEKYLKNNKEISQDEYGKAQSKYEELKGEQFKPTQHYSNLTVPGGTNGSYREVNIESPLITLPKSHAQFNTEHTLMFSRMDDAQTYSEIDIEKLISLMKNSGQLEIKCS